MVRWDELSECWRIDNGSALCVCVQQCALSTVVWGMQCGSGASSQANRLRASCLQRQRGRGGRPENSGSTTTPSSLFALRWFSHQTRLLNQRPPSTKTANYASARCPPLCCFRVPIRVLSFSTPFYVASILFSPVPPLTYFSVLVKWEKNVLHLWPSAGVCATLTLPLLKNGARSIKCNCSWGVKLTSPGYCGTLCLVG